MKNTISIVLLSALLSGALPALSFAQTSTSTPSTTSSSITQLLAQIQQIQQQIAALQQQQQALQQQQVAVEKQLVSALRQGSQGDQVKILQALLAADPAVYPEGLITGFYGQATTNAVRRFQKLWGISQLGIVGPKTLKKLNELLEETPILFESTSTVDSTSATSSVSGTSSMPGISRWHEEDRDNEDEDNDRENEREHDGRPCVIVPPGHLIAPGWLRKHDGERPIVPACQIIPPGIAEKLGWIITPTSTPTSTTDTTAPSISNIGVNASTTSILVTWNTNEPATSQIFYGTSASYGSSSTLDNALVNTHNQTLSGLMPGTVYHFAVVSKDAAGNTSTSSDQTVSTAADTVAPVISYISAVPSSTSAAISWTTNKLSSSKVFYSTSTVNLASSLNVSSSTLVTGHLVNLSGLTASTTYNYIVESVDAANNKADSAQQSFVTVGQ